MSFAYETDTADDIPDLFDRLETFLTGIGWTIEDGTGTTTVIVKSAGEAGGRTKLYARIRRNAGTTQRVYIRLQDDLGGTHATQDPDDSYTGYLEAPGTGDSAFPYFICGDKDAVIICFKSGAGYTGIYFGLVEPMAATIPDEEYQYVVCGLHKRATSPTKSGRVLRAPDDLWNQLLYTYENSDSYIKNPLDNSYPLFGGFCGAGAATEYIGEFLHCSGNIEAVPGLSSEDTIETGIAGATTTWLVLGTLTHRWAIRTGGIYPYGQLEAPHYATETGVATSIANFVGKIKAFMTARGWTEVENPSPDYLHDWYMNSPGESGSDDIWIRIYYNDADRFGCYAMDSYSDSQHTTSAALGGATNPIVEGSFPMTYWFTGDRDCIVMCVFTGGKYGYHADYCNDTP